MIGAALGALFSRLRLIAKKVRKRMGVFYEYLAPFFSHWFAILTAGSLFGIKEIGENYWHKVPDSISKLSLKIPLPIRKHYATSILVAAVFYAGFLAWKDEHAIRVDAELHAERKIARPQRVLSEDQKARLIKYAEPMKPQFAQMWIWIASADDLESQRFAQNIVHALHTAGLHSVYLGASPVEPGDHDIAIQLPDPDHPSEIAKATIDLLSKSAIPFSVVMDTNDYPVPPDVIIAVSPPNN